MCTQATLRSGQAASWWKIRHNKQWKCFPVEMIKHGLMSILTVKKAMTTGTVIVGLHLYSR